MIYYTPRRARYHYTNDAVADFIHFVVSREINDRLLKLIISVYLKNKMIGSTVLVLNVQIFTQ